MTEEAYRWCAIYNDEQCLSEEDADNFACVDTSRTRFLVLLPRDNTRSSHMVMVPFDAQPVFFRRRSITLDLQKEEECNRSTTHCIGWKNEDEACYLFIREDGSTVLADYLQAI